jgi:hypothetical protein
MVIFVIFLFSCNKNKISENIDVSIDQNTNNQAKIFCFEDTDSTIISNNKAIYEENNGEYFNLKIIRLENNGRMNIIPCFVFIYNNMELVDNKNVNVFYQSNPNIKLENRLYSDHFYLIGGDTAFLMLPNGNYNIKFITPKKWQAEYLGETDDWESIIYDFKIIQDEYKEIRIIPGGDFGYNGTWEIEKL